MSNADNRNSERSMDNETLRQQLRVQWDDHFQTRSQTWRALQMQAASVLAVIAADIKLNDIQALQLLGLITIGVALFGMFLTVHHRRVQMKKFEYIWHFEEELGLHDSKYLGNIPEPNLEHFRWWQIIWPGGKAEIRTPTYIFLCQLALLGFTLLYIWVRVNAA